VTTSTARTLILLLQLVKELDLYTLSLSLQQALAGLYQHQSLAFGHYVVSTASSDGSTLIEWDN